MESVAFVSYRISSLDRLSAGKPFPPFRGLVATRVGDGGGGGPKEGREGRVQRRRASPPRPSMGSTCKQRANLI
jgi:hypothetical protein